MINALNAIAQAQAPAKVTGTWYPLTLQLDRANGDRLNIGVLFTNSDTQRATWRLLTNFSGVRCLYGPDAASNAAFAVDQVHSYLQKNAACPANWVIDSGVPAFASGESDQEIVARLYARTVALARHEQPDDEQLDSDDHKLSTQRLRRRVRDLIKRRFETKDIPNFWKDTPVQLSTNDGRRVALDLQVWSETGTASGVMAAVTSAWYTSKFHRDAYLSNSYRALVEARQITGGSSKAGMYVLRPFKNPRFNDQQISEIDNEIDNIYWSLSKVKVDVHVFDNEETMTNQLLATC